MDRFDFTKGLAAALRGGPATWDYARGIADFWGSPLSPGDGCSEAELAAAESRLGTSLPAALREGYGLLGRRSDLTSNQDPLRRPGDLQMWEGALVFRDENQSCCCWGIPADRLRDEDPPVLVRPDLADKRAERWEPWADSVSAAFTQILLTEPLFAADPRSDFCSEPEDDVLDRLEREFTALELPAPGQIRWYAGQQAQIVAFEDSILAARARSPELLDGLRELLGGTWLGE